MVEVDGGTPLIGERGAVTLLDAFEGRRQLIAYYFMWHAGHPAPEQCEGCTWVTSQVRELSYSTASGQRIYREVQVKFGKLYPVGPAWEREHFDFTSWRFFKEDEFASQIDQSDFFIAYILARDIGYNRDIFIFPVRDFAKIIRCGIPSKGQRKVYLSRLKGDSEPWVLRRSTRFSQITEDSCLDVTGYRRNFRALIQTAD